MATLADSISSQIAFFRVDLAEYKLPDGHHPLSPGIQGETIVGAITNPQTTVPVSLRW